MSRSRYIFFSLPLLALSIASCHGKQDEKQAKGGRPKDIKAEGYIVEPQAYQNNYTASGSLLPNEAIEIHPEISGRVTGLFFTEGTYVKKGQTLVQINDAEIRAQIQKLKAQKQLQVKLLERQKELVNIGGISQQDYETTQTNISSIDADIAFSEAQLRSTKIVAPFDGKIGIRSISLGAVISPTTLITVLQQTHQLKMDFTVPDRYRDIVKNGNEVFFSVSGSLDTLSGKISAVDPGADQTTRTIRVRAIVPNPDNKLSAGSFAHVVVPFESNNNAILVPSQAIIPTTRDKQVALVKNGKASIVTVQLGDRTAGKVEVVQGLQAGDTVITTGIMQVKPGMDVKITKLNRG
ncbi:MAG: efflux RND transporter periplasmic adaptor subunit [Sphingobacteriales bacterium]|nr:MAG: efflux RND transporter periplasmic adaptor subunit [Sphingobacteriales bacterium]